MNSLNIGICQMQSVDDEDKNLKQISSLLYEQNLAEIDIVCFPENSLYFQIDMDTSKNSAVSLSGESMGYLQDLSNQTDTVFHLGGVPILEEGRMYNSTVWIEPFNEVKIIYKKIHLFDVELKDRSIRESKTFTAGEQPSLIEYKNFKLAQSICYDLRFSNLYEYYAKKEADVIFVPAAFFAETGRLHWHILLRARAIECQAYVVASAQAGLHEDENGRKRKTYGHSLIIDPNGKIIAEGSADSPEFIKAKISKDEISQFRAKIPMNQARKIIKD